MRFAGIWMMLTWLVNSGVAQTYSVKDLGALQDLAGRTDAGPNGINNAGQVVESNVTGGAYRALVFNGSWTNLGTLGGNESLGSSINEAGQVVGNSLTSGGLTHAFVWIPGGGGGVPGNPQMVDLGTLGGSGSQAYGINRSGQISGFAQTSRNEHAFVFSGGTMTDIGASLSGMPNSFGYSINSSGQVAGTAYNSSYSTSHAFFFDGATTKDLGTFGGQSASALAINDQAQITGYVTGTNGFDRAFRYTAGVMTDLATLGGHYSYGLSINNSNVIVGGSFLDSRDTIYHAFIAGANLLVDLNGMLDASGAGWTLVEARAINDSGQIAGVGTYAGAKHTFLLTPVSTEAPVIQSVRLIASDVLISFTTVANGDYALETSATLPNGGWSTLASGITGTGGVVTVTNVGAAGWPAGFYRVERTIP